MQCKTEIEATGFGRLGMRLASRSGRAKPRDLWPQLHKMRKESRFNR